MGKAKSGMGCFGVSMGCGAVIGITCILICSGIGLIGYQGFSAAKQVADENFADAERLYDQGQIAQAVEKYKQAFSLTGNSADRNRIITRVLTFEAKQSIDSAESLDWADRAVKNDISFDDVTIQKLVDDRRKVITERQAQAKAEREDKEAKNKLEVETMARRSSDLKKFFKHPNTVKADWLPKSWFLKNGGIAYSGTVKAKNAFNLEIEHAYHLEYSALGELTYVEIDGEVLISSK